MIPSLLNKRRIGVWDLKGDLFIFLNTMLCKHNAILIRIDGQNTCETLEGLKEYDLLFIPGTLCDAGQELLKNVALLWRESNAAPEVIISKPVDDTLDEYFPEPWFWILSTEFVDYERLASLAQDALISSTARYLQLPAATGVDRLNKWLNQFKEDHIPSMFSLLRFFRYYDSRRIIELLNAALVKAADKHIGRRYWLTSLGRPNKSGPVTLALAGKTKWVKEQTKAGKVHFHESRVLPQELLGCLASSNKLSDISLTVVFVDDVCGSGGQLFSYGKKFFDTLKKETERLFGSNYGRQVWERLKKAIQQNAIVFVCIYAIGVKHKGLEMMVSNKKYVQTNETSKQRDNYRTMHGKVTLASDGSDSFPACLIIQDYTPHLYELLEMSDRNSVYEAWLSGMPWVKPRAKEHWLQFEPVGWKDSKALVSTYFNCPGNTLPMIWGDHPDPNGNEREPLFTRAFNPFDQGTQKAEEIAERLLVYLTALRKKKNMTVKKHENVASQGKKVAEYIKKLVEDCEQLINTLYPDMDIPKLSQAVAYVLNTVTNVDKSFIKRATGLEEESFFKEYGEELKNPKLSDWKQRTQLVKCLVSDGIWELP